MISIHRSRISASGHVVDVGRTRNSRNSARRVSKESTYRGDANAAEVGVGLELLLEGTLLHVVERDDMDGRLAAVLLPCRPDLFHDPRDLAAIGEALHRQVEIRTRMVIYEVYRFNDGKNCCLRQLDGAR